MQYPEKKNTLKKIFQVKQSIILGVGNVQQENIVGFRRLLIVHIRIVIRDALYAEAIT